MLRLIRCRYAALIEDGILLKLVKVSFSISESTAIVKMLKDCKIACDVNLTDFQAISQIAIGSLSNTIWLMIKSLGSQICVRAESGRAAEGCEGIQC